jgi:hypothetical protein
MAQVSLSERVLLNGYDLSCYLNRVGSEIQRELKSANVFCTLGAKTNKKGLHEVTVTAEGFNEFDPTADSIINTLFQNAVVQDAENLMMYSAGGYDVGDLAVMLNLNTPKYSIDPIESGELIMASLSGTGTQATGTIAHATGIWLLSQTVTGAVNGTSYDNAATSVGWVAQAHNVDADGTATIKIQHSSNNSTWVDLITFTAVPANTAAAQAINTATTVNRYVRAIVTAIGGTTAQVSVAIQLGYTG